MSTRTYRLAVVWCMLSWFLLGMHAPMLHAFTAHGRAPRPSLLVAVALLTVIALGGLWMLWRAPRRSEVVRGATGSA